MAITSASARNRRGGYCRAGRSPARSWPVDLYGCHGRHSVRTTGDTSFRALFRGREPWRSRAGTDSGCAANSCPSDDDGRSASRWAAGDGRLAAPSRRLTKDARHDGNDDPHPLPEGPRLASKSGAEWSPRSSRTPSTLLVDNVETVIKGKSDVVRLAVVAIMCEGHVLFEDLPGTGKSVAGPGTGADDERHQQPGAVHAGHAPRRHHGVVDLRPAPAASSSSGPARSSPTSSWPTRSTGPRRRPSPPSSRPWPSAGSPPTASTYELPRPFIVLATQNPVEQAGTFPLPEAQLDRFLFKLSMGYMTKEAELEVMFDNSVVMLHRRARRRPSTPRSSSR